MMISLSGVKKIYQDGEASHQVLGGVDLEVSSGEFVAIQGSSGSGKSTLLNIVGGLDSRFSGRVVVDGQSLQGQKDKDLSDFRARKVGFVFQSFHLISELTTLQNVSLPAWFNSGDKAFGSKEAIEKRAREVLDAVGLLDKAKRPPDNLSGGERQRVAIARAIFSRPKLLLCDEPTGNLDAATGDEVIRVFKDLNQEGMTFLIVTHEARVADAAHRLLYLSNGLLEEICRRRCDARAGNDGGKKEEVEG